MQAKWRVRETPSPGPSFCAGPFNSEAKMTEPQPPFPDQSQTPPGMTSQMEPKPDHGEQSYKLSLIHI